VEITQSVPLPHFYRVARVKEEDVLEGTCIRYIDHVAGVSPDLWLLFLLFSSPTSEAAEWRLTLSGFVSCRLAD